MSVCFYKICNFFSANPQRSQYFPRKNRALWKNRPQTIFNFFFKQWLKLLRIILNHVKIKSVACQDFFPWGCPICCVQLVSFKFLQTASQYYIAVDYLLNLHFRGSNKCKEIKFQKEKCFGNDDKHQLILIEMRLGTEKINDVTINYREQS